MTLSHDQRNQLFKHPAFAGAHENECEKLVAQGTFLSLEAGQSLQNRYVPGSFVLILSGELSVPFEYGVTESMLPVPAGNWIGDCQTCKDWIAWFAFLQSRRELLQITATCSTLLFSVPENALKSAPLQEQMRLIKNLDVLSQTFTENLVIKGVALGVRAQRLQTYIADHIRQKNVDYDKSEIIRSILQNYPRLPLFAGKLITMLQQEHTSAADIVDAAKLDPSLAGLILRVANSSYYNLPQKVTDFQHAVLLLGFSQIYQMLMESSIQSIMPKSAEFQKLRFDSVMLSLISFEIALAATTIKPVTAATIGLLQCIGKSVILLLKKQHPAAAILIDGLDHGKLGAMLLKTWNIPDLVCQTIELQSVPEFAEPSALPEQCRKQSAVLYLAQLCYQYLEGKNEQEIPTMFLAEYQSELGISPLHLAEFLRKHVKHGLQKKASTCPENIRLFLESIERRWR